MRELISRRTCSPLPRIWLITIGGTPSSSPTVVALTRAFANELGPRGIRVNATAAGGTEAPPRKISRGTPEPSNETERAWFQAHIDQTKQSCLMKRYGTLDEMAAPILFLASDESSYMSGSELVIDGGYTAQ